MTPYCVTCLLLMGICSLVRGTPRIGMSDFNTEQDAAALKRNPRSLPLTMKSILKGSNYMGIKSRTKLYEKKGDKSTAISDFFALEPSQIIHRDAKYMMGIVGDGYVHLNLRAPLTLLVQGKQYFRMIWYKPEATRSQYSRGSMLHR